MNRKELQERSQLANKEEEVLEALRDFLHEDYGIYFSDDKLYSLSKKVNQRIRNLPVDSLSDYVQYLRDHPNEEIQKFIDNVSTNKTLFFREPKHWQFLKERILPSLDLNGTVKMWSAACSTGEEPYTLSMILDDYIRGGSPSWSNNSNHESAKNFKILATDIARRAVLEAQRGVYMAKKLENVIEYEKSFRDRYFEPLDDSSKHQVCEHLKSSVTFRKFNLKSTSYLCEDTFSLVLCRNVLIYFDNEMVEHVIDQLSTCLKPGGYLFVGHTESLQNIDHDLEKIRPAIYRRPETTHVRDGELS